MNKFASRTRILGLVVCRLSLSLLVVALAGCSGYSGATYQPPPPPPAPPAPPAPKPVCPGCLFLFATTASGVIYSISGEASGDFNEGDVTVLNSAPGPAGSEGIIAIPNIPTVQKPQPTTQGELYVSDPALNSIRAYNINGQAYAYGGSLTPASFGAFSLAPAGGMPGHMELFDGHLVVMNSDGQISVLNRNADSSLTAIAGSPFTAPSGMSRFCAMSWASNSPQKFLYAINPSDPIEGIAGFSMADSGALTPLPGSPFPLPSGTGALTLACPEVPVSNALYVGMRDAGAITAFAIAADGSLSPVAGSPFAAGRGTSSLVVESGFLYAQNSADATISGYALDPGTGVLTALPGSPFPSAATSATLTGDGGFGGYLFLPDASGATIYIFAADAKTGFLTPVHGSPVSYANLFNPVEAVVSLRFMLYPF